MKALRYFLLCRAKRNAGELIFLTLMFIFSALYIAKSQYPFFEMYLGLRSLSLFAAMKVWQSGPVGFSHCGLLRIGWDDSVSFGCRI